MESNKWWKQMQPLRIPTGWNVVWNRLEDIEPETLPENSKGWLDFSQDILFLSKIIKRRKSEETIGIDLGWYPDCDPEGSFRLDVIKNGDWEHPFLTFSSRSKAEIVEKMEEWLFQNL